MLVRKAQLQDASNVYDLVNSLSTDGTLLKRVFAEICENIRDFTVAESDAGVFLGCGALHFYGPHLCEVRSIVVTPEPRARERADASSARSLKKPSSTAFNPSASSRAFPTFSSSMDFGSLKTKRSFPTRSSRTASCAHACIAATKWPWSADAFPACPSSARAKKRRCWCGFRGEAAFSF